MQRRIFKIRLYITIFIVIIRVKFNPIYRLTKISKLYDLIEELIIKYLLFYENDKYNTESKNLIESLKYSLSHLLYPSKYERFEKPKKDFSELYQNLTNYQEIETIISKYFSIRLFAHKLFKTLLKSDSIKGKKFATILIESIFKNHDISNSIKKEVKKLNLKIVEIQTIDELNNQVKGLKEELKTLNKSLISKYSLRIDLSKINLGAFFSFFSGLTILTGFFYYRVFLKAFDIDITKYFSLSDYVASSIEKIEYAVVGAAIATFSLFIGLRNNYFNIVQEKKYFIKNYINSAVILHIIYFAFVIYGFIQNKNLTYYINSSLILMVSWSNILASSISSKYMKNYLNSYLILTFIISYFGYLGYKLHGDISNVKNGTIKTQEKILFKESLGFDNQNIIILGKNSKYLFVRDTIKDKSIVIPNDYVKLIECIK